MLISVDQNHVVTGFCMFGDNGLANPIEINAEALPKNFNFVTNKYLYSDGKVIENPAYQVPKDDVEPSENEQRMRQLQALIMQQNQSNAKLQSANEQQAKQIEQLQQMFMLTNQQQAIEKSKEATAQ